jgi:hypothetical protein
MSTTAGAKRKPIDKGKGPCVLPIGHTCLKVGEIAVCVWCGPFY